MNRYLNLMIFIGVLMVGIGNAYAGSGDADLFVENDSGSAPTDVPRSCNICELQSVIGPCDGYFPRYYYDVDAGECKEFIYGGCEGNKNNFQTLESCETKCENLPSMQEKGTCWKGPNCGGEPIYTLLPVNCQECKQIGGKSVNASEVCDNCKH